MKKNHKGRKNSSTDAHEDLQSYHIPVLLNEVIENLNIKADGVYVDCTFGGGGHSKAILQRLNENGRLIAFDQDEDARRNIPGDERVLFIPNNFRYLQRFLRLNGIIPKRWQRQSLRQEEHRS